MFDDSDITRDIFSSEALTVAAGIDEISSASPRLNILRDTVECLLVGVSKKILDFILPFTTFDDCSWWGIQWQKSAKKAPKN